MNWTEYHSNLRETLAGLFYTREQARPVITDAALGNITWSEDPRILWQSAVEKALRMGRVAALVDAALKLEPGAPLLIEAKNADVHRARGDALQDDSWLGEPKILEKIIGPESQLLPVWFLRAGNVRSAAVCRVLRADKTVGTGFLVGDDLLVTNCHVIPDAATAASAKAEFNFELTDAGLETTIDRCDLVPDKGFWPSSDCDLAIVRLARNMASVYGAIAVNTTSVRRGDRLSIIQHAGGQAKQVALSNNAVVYVDDERVQYLTDTLGGSSGSPVFDRSWQLVAVHRAGGWMHEPGSKQPFYRNEGIPVAKLHAALSKAGLLTQQAAGVT